MRKIRTLVKKEVTDILRDRKTLILMVLVPVLLYPTIMIGMTLVMNSYMMAQAEKEYTIGYTEECSAIIENLERIYEQEPEDELDGSLTFAMISKEESDAWLSQTEESGVVHVQIDYNSTDSDSSYAKNAVRDLLDSYSDELLEANLADQGLTQDFLNPLVYEVEDAATESESFGMSLGGSLGMLLVVTIFMGAMYPAIDATTGEKERGTLETLLTLPVTNFQMIMSKYISVSIFACVTALLTLVSSGGSILFMAVGLTTEAVEFAPMSAGTIVLWLFILVLVMVSTALLISAVCMCFCIFAKSFKEANNYITPVMLIVMFASMVGMVPSMRLEYQTALIPIVNISLLIKEVLSQNFVISLAGITIGSNFAYSVLVVWILAKMYDSENVLFADGFQSFRVFQKRSEIKKGTVPAMGDLVLSFTVLLLLMLYVGSAVTIRNAFLGAFVQQVMILAIPLLVTWYLKTDKKELFTLAKPEKGTVIGSILFFAGVYLVNRALANVLSAVFEQSAENVGAAFEEFTKQPLVLILFVVAIMPAIGEELLFRGVLYGSLRHKFGGKWAILISAIVFGAFHMSVVKFIPTGFMGAALAYVVYRSGSIYIGMVFHFVNNAISMIALKYPEVIEKVFPILIKDSLSVSEMMIMTGIGLILISVGLSLHKNRKKVVDSYVAS